MLRCITNGDRRIRWGPTTRARSERHWAPSGSHRSRVPYPFPSTFLWGLRLGAESFPHVFHAHAAPYRDRPPAPRHVIGSEPHRGPSGESERELLWSTEHLNIAPTPWGPPRPQAAEPSTWQIEGRGTRLPLPVASPDASRGTRGGLPLAGGRTWPGLLSLGWWRVN
ncbi:uncharacterized protein J3R85_004186 [Psidium guajava]|nr:uncharacterized protein J3R85_004186 [Psidium guajava]